MMHLELWTEPLFLGILYFFIGKILLWSTYNLAVNSSSFM